MASKKVLGRGLSAFFPEYEDENKTNKEEQSKEGKGGKEDAAGTGTYVEPEQRVNIVLQVPVDNIRANPHQPRKEFNEERLEELAGSIENHGLIQPITVRYIGEKRFELISGERRLRAAKRAGIEELPAYIREVNDEDIISYALIENIQREDLNPIEVALGYQRLVEEADYTQAEVARRVGKNRSTVANMLRLLNLPPFIQAGLRDEKISMGHARALISVEDPDDQEAIYKKIIKKGYSVRQTEKAVKALTEEKTTSQSSSGQDRQNAFLKEISGRLRNKLSTKVKIKSKKNGGEIRIEYYSDEELDRLLGLFENIS
ncbi:ParB/RepB/Spo0J family partition protein [Fodinibius sp.]|uniref:ParB/RepB/Spo0J family partition protein n=1 Tax=Fodinibius sp. TaxID=1872440 RepID=UPI00356A203A